MLVQHARTTPSSGREFVYPPGMTMTTAELTAFLCAAFPDLDMQRWTVLAAADQGVRVRLSVTGRHARPGGTVYGPALMELADMAAYLCVLAPIGPVALAVTTSLTIHFLRRPALRDVVADARALKRGKRLCVVEVTLRTEGEDDPVAHATVTYSLPPA
jgi:uncharacterized protein (TIGR00369 family)